MSSIVERFIVTSKFGYVVNQAVLNNTIGATSANMLDRKEMRGLVFNKFQYPEYKWRMISMAAVGEPVKCLMVTQKGIEHDYCEEVFVTKVNMPSEITNDAEEENFEVRGRFKIHGLNTCNGKARSANTDKFYGTYQEAEIAAGKMLSGKIKYQEVSPQALVIFKAIKVITLKDPEPEPEINRINVK